MLKHVSNCGEHVDRDGHIALWQGLNGMGVNICRLQGSVYAGTEVGKLTVLKNMTPDLSAIINTNFPSYTVCSHRAHSEEASNSVKA